MPIIRINADGAYPVLHDSPRAVNKALTDALQRDGPVVIMVHGYRFLPHDPLHCPHTHIFSTRKTHDCPKALSWPQHLGIADRPHGAGIAIAFGWAARRGLRTAQQTAEVAASALVRVVRMVRQMAPEKPINLIAHSMGAHLALSAMSMLTPGDLARVVLLNGATYQSHAERALQSPAGQLCELFNVVSNENRIYDTLFECVFPKQTPSDRALGRGLEGKNVLTIRIDRQPVLEALGAKGFGIAPARHFHCHWSTYLRPGVFSFYRTLLITPETLPFYALKSLLEEVEHQTRPTNWRLPLPGPLPGFAKQAS
ncbi:alpha/beta hydrolase [Shimia sp. SDUM112013]|uniref:alpha/beta hydrolase n=1 Tax=Shimia sp. SDUM112013 TaxID=3136160 RepID=UPI0032EAEDE0